MGLDIGVVGPEEGFDTLAGQGFGFVNEEIAAVVATAGVAFAVFVGEGRAGRFKHRRRGEVLRGDELKTRVLSAGLAADDVEHFIITDLWPGHSGFSFGATGAFGDLWFRGLA